MTFLSLRSFGITVSLLTVMAADAEAQLTVADASLLRTTSASYYFVAKPGELTMQVNLWGFVRNPGYYEIPTSTDLVQLLSYAGGPIQDATLGNVKVTRNIKNEDGSSGRWSYTVDLEDLEEVPTDQLLLYPGDTIFIDYSSWLTMRDIFQVITVAAVVTTAVSSVIIAASRTP